MENKNTEFQIGELSKLTKIKTGTIRFYEKCGFLSPAKRLSNGYRVFEEKHIYQARICSFVFGGFVNKRLRKLSMELIFSAREWDLAGYKEAAENYLRAVREDIAGTKRAIETVQGRMAGSSFSSGEGSGKSQDNKSPLSLKEKSVKSKDDFLREESGEEGYSKKQAAALIGVTSESIRNWERNGLLGQTKPYQKRYYSQNAMERMEVIRLLLDNGYSMMAVRKFFAAFDKEGAKMAAKILTAPGENETLIYRADRYLETLLQTEKKAEELFGLFDEMCLLSE